MSGEELNVLSLFDGLSGCRIALERIGITPKNYYASEIDKYAIKVAQANYPDTIQLGSVTDWTLWDIDWASIDLVTGGFPCQAWSVAGKQQGDKDERGMLFWVMLDIMRNVLDHNPQAKFLIENVKMKKEFEQYITHHTEQALGHVHKTLINSSLVSAQNRQRYYWTNFEVSQPEDKGLVLADIVEGGIVDRDKSHCLDANYFKGGNLKSYFEKNRRQLVFSKDGLCCVGEAELNGNDQIKRVYAVEGKSPTLTTTGGGHREPKLLINPVVRATVQSNAEHTYNGKTPTITAAMGMGGGNVPLMTFDVDVATKFKGKYIDANDRLLYRKLTPLECERLQTLPDNYTAGVSNSQRYKMIGNGWTIDVIAHILKAGITQCNEREDTLLCQEKN
jgi:DNA (cytosine-5)-methyltransferase 1/DNA (cytosine-5)-methyltransferase 3A